LRKPATNLEKYLLKQENEKTYLEKEVGITGRKGRPVVWGVGKHACGDKA